MPVLSVQSGNHSRESEELVYNICKYMFGFSDDQVAEIICRYSESHRHYHNLDHIARVIEAVNHTMFILNSPDSVMMHYAAIFHDIVYDPKSKTNEEDSANVMNSFLDHRESPEFIKKIEGIILATKTHSKFNTTWEKEFCRCDLDGFEQSLQSILEDEKKIRKEYAWVDWALYQSTRPEILGKFLQSELLSDNAKRNIQFEIEYLQFTQPNIAIYPGTFSPFHVGHLHILEKAERIFDKVIVAMGHNPEKKFKAKAYDESPCMTLQYRQVDFYEGLLTDYLKTKPYPVTVIRGLRNTTDMMAEVNQYRWLQELSNNDIKMVSIFCDKEYEHISSSSIRNVEQYGTAIYEKYIVR